MTHNRKKNMLNSKEQNNAVSKSPIQVVSALNRV